MKIRIKGNSVRFRLSRPEIEKFGNDGYIEEKTEFLNNTFCYAIQKLFDGTTLDASFTGQKLTVFVPKAIMQEWVNSDVVGYSHYLPLSEEKSLFLLIEKDYKCIDGDESEDQSDYYDNPVKTC
ncbi:MAG: hypothetical protein EOP42_01445 [Sphingobacteriaceae bacterium]|nr:MAG: hypothetical protein EOP42_01445 [Sphingobacteriaceae bacterium]